MLMSRETLTALLDEFAQWLEFEDSGPINWVVCGGVAMALQDLNQRTTQDVDVLGEWNAELLEIACVEVFPEKVQSCIRRVVENHPELAGFGDKWINLGPSRLARLGLPAGYGQRLTTVKFRGKLTLQLLSRVDLLPLKLYAASDEFSHRQEIHFQDLRALKASFDELDQAIEWVRTLPDFEKTRTELRHVLERLGHDDLAYYV